MIQTVATTLSVDFSLAVFGFLQSSSDIPVIKQKYFLNEGIFVAFSFIFKTFWDVCSMLVKITFRCSLRLRRKTCKSLRDMAMTHLLLAFCRRKPNYQINKVVAHEREMRRNTFFRQRKFFLSNKNAFDSNLISKWMHLDVFQVLSIFLDSVRNVSDFSTHHRVHIFTQIFTFHADPYCIKRF